MTDVGNTFFRLTITQNENDVIAIECDLRFTLRLPNMFDEKKPDLNNKYIQHEDRSKTGWREKVWGI